MKRLSFVLALTLAAPAFAYAQDADRSVAGGGITVAGWKGKIDAASVKAGKTINDSKFFNAGGDLHLTIGPPAIYWNPANTASGDYTVGATFLEAKPDAGHPHSYGVFIGGKDLDTDAPNLVYCVAYSNGTFLVRGFSGGQVVTYTRRGPHDAVAKAVAGGPGVTQNIAWTVKGGTAACSINGQVVGSFDATTLLGAGKLTSTDGIYGIRVTHNVDLHVSGFGKK